MSKTNVAVGLPYDDHGPAAVVSPLPEDEETR